MTCIDYSPTSFEVRLDRLIRRELPVNARRDGSVATGFDLEDIKINPSVTIVSGPESEVRKLRSVETELVDLTGLQSSKIIELPLRPEGLKSVVTPTTVKVELIIGPKQSARIFEGVKVQVGGGSGIAAQARPSQARVIARGSADVLKNIDETRLRVFVDASNLSDGEHQVEAKMNPPDGVRSVSIDPPSITVIVSKKSKSGNRVSNATILDRGETNLTNEESEKVGKKS